jgi:hypothetical protein
MSVLANASASEISMPHNASWHSIDTLDLTNCHAITTLINWAAGGWGPFSALAVNCPKLARVEPPHECLLCECFAVCVWPCGCVPHPWANPAMGCASHGMG